MGRNQKLKQAKKKAKATPELKLDFGCGKNPREGFAGVDVMDFGQKYIADLAAFKKDSTPEWMVLMPPTPERMRLFEPWPWPDNSVDEAHTSHFIEHLTALQRVHFVNELWRVLKPEAKCTVVAPHWASSRAYGDMTHQWPPVAEFWFYYLSPEWRKVNAPHNDAYSCNFAVTWGHSLHSDLNNRNEDYRINALRWWKDAAQDTIATFVKQPMPKP